MPGGPFYLLDQPSPLSTGPSGTLQDGGTPPPVANTTTGWVVSTTAGTSYSAQSYGVTKAASSFATSPTQPQNVNLINSWRTAFPLTGSYLAGNWVFSVALISKNTSADGTGNLRVILGYGQTGNDTGGLGLVTDVFSVQVMSSISNLLTSGSQNSTLTISVPAFTLNQSYLYIALGWEITVASSSSASDVHFVQDGVHSIITPTTFVPAPPSGIITSGFGSANNQGSAADPMYPRTGGLDPYLPAQQYLASAGGPVRNHAASSGGPAITMGFGSKNLVHSGAIVVTGGAPNTQHGSSDQTYVGIVGPVALPPFAELPPVQALENGRSLGVTGGFAGQTTTGFGIAAETGRITYGGPPPPYADLPPAQALPSNINRSATGAPGGKISMGGYNSLSLGGGLFRLPASILDNVPLPPVAPDLPPVQQLLLAVKKADAAARGIIGPFALSVGQGDAASPAVILDNIELPPVPDLPPAQFVFAGFGNAASNGTILDNIFLPPSADLPPTDDVIAGHGQAAQPGIVIDNVFLPFSVELPTPEFWFSGHGQAAQPPRVVRQDLLPPETLLPPEQFVLKGFGQAAQPPRIITGPPDPRSPWPSTTAELITGFGQAAQPPVVVRQDLLPPVADLPPVPELLAGFGQAARAPAIITGPPDPRSPYPTGSAELLAGFGQAAQVGVVVEAFVLPPAAALPPQDFLFAGFGRTPAASVYESRVPEFASLPPASLVFVGATSTSTARPTVWQAFELPPAADLPPVVALFAGVPIQAHPQIGIIYQPPILPALVELPPISVVVVGTQVVVVFVEVRTDTARPIVALTDLARAIPTVTASAAPMSMVTDTAYPVVDITSAASPEDTATDTARPVGQPD